MKPQNYNIVCIASDPGLNSAEHETYMQQHLGASLRLGDWETLMFAEFIIYNYFSLYKIVFIGDGKVGKSSLISRYVVSFVLKLWICFSLSLHNYYNNYRNFVRLIFVAAIDYENIFTMKISRSTLFLFSSSLHVNTLLVLQDNVFEEGQYISTIGVDFVRLYILINSLLTIAYSL